MKRSQWSDYTVTFRPMSDWQPAEALTAYSYDKPSTCFWNGFMNGLLDAGFTEKAAKEWIRSKAARWRFDGDMSEKVEKLAYNFARSQAEQYATREQCEKWAKQAA